MTIPRVAWVQSAIAVFGLVMGMVVQTLIVGLHEGRNDERLAVVERVAVEVHDRVDQLGDVYAKQETVDAHLSAVRHELETMNQRLARIETTIEAVRTQINGGKK